MTLEKKFEQFTNRLRDLTFDGWEDFLNTEMVHGDLRLVVMIVISIN